MTDARKIKSGTAQIAAEAFGDPTHTPVLLIMGAMASMLWWPDAFCRRLAARGYRVVRYDNRDTGLSTACEPGRPDYTGDDLTDDAVRVLDGYGIERAHIVGMSMGGGIAQSIALKYPERASSLVCISTSVVGMSASHLPGVTDAYRKHAAQGEKIDWSDRDQFVDFVVSDMRAVAGTAHPFDEGKARSFVERDTDRARNFASATNHFLVASSDQPPGRSDEISAPTLVIHGASDPLFPIQHGEALASAVGGSRFVCIEGGGHEIHEMDWPQYLDAIEAHVETAIRQSASLQAKAFTS